MAVVAENPPGLISGGVDHLYGLGGGAQIENLGTGLVI
jgi:hypothetical protein